MGLINVFDLYNCILIYTIIKTNIAQALISLNKTFPSVQTTAQISKLMNYFKGTNTHPNNLMIGGKKLVPYVKLNGKFITVKQAKKISTSTSVKTLKKKKKP